MAYGRIAYSLIMALALSQIAPAAPRPPRHAPGQLLIRLRDA